MNWDSKPLTDSHIMNTHQLLGIATVATLLATAPLFAAEITRFDSLPGGKMRIEGSSSVHDWQVEGKLIGGFLEAGPGFPVEPGQTVAPGKIEAKAEVFVPVRSLTSVEKDGRPYSTRMDEIMYEKLKQPASPRIVYRLNELVLKEAPKTATNAYIFDAKGELVVAGATNQISMPVHITPLGGKKLRITGTTTMKMTGFGIEPPAPAVALGLIKTEDQVKVIFDWNVGQRAAAPPR
jgi:hypothetical protein